MNLIALLVSLVIERLATQYFHWRRMPWLDRVIDAGIRNASGKSTVSALSLVLLLTLVLVLPVLIVSSALNDTLLGFPYLVLSIAVLFFSLGPKDVGEDVDEYCRALEAGDEETARRRAETLIEGELPEDQYEATRAVEAAVFVQANNRLFAVIFWFFVLGPLGPLGAWTYRITDLIRRRAVLNALRQENEEASAAAVRVQAVASGLHAFLAWIPARLTAIGYAIAGHFDAAIEAWRTPRGEPGGIAAGSNESLLARVGVGAMALDEVPDEDLVERSIRGATTANSLVFRLLLIWVVIIAAMTLYGWTA
ncbi:MAG TPA: regulatory signaling modulator protein AmpE [Woeseiaceae bacterium]|nr:regulatory signaling modulator protein AmpE [Woeseiaceae bacterium]